MASHTGKRRSLFGIDNAVYSESDAETISYDYDESSDDGENLSSDEFSSDSEVSESESDLLQDVRVWCAIDVEHPPAAPPRFPFTGQPGLQVPLNDEQDPLTYVRLFLDEDIMISIVTETNRYAEQTLTRTPHRPLSRTRNWEPITVDDLWLFFGVIVLQGIVHKPQQRWYWSTNRLLETPIFGKIMSEYKFTLIMKFLHFTNNDNFDETTHPAPKLKKIWEVYQALLENFQKVYTPSRDISVDESLMSYKGRIGWMQYIPSKRARFGIKFFMLCESQTGYIWNSVLYTGKGTKFSKKYADYGLSTASVLSLADKLLGKGYCITMDNFYTSPDLLDILIKNKTDAYGTVRSNRKNLPNNFTKEKLKRGDVRAWQKGKMMALRWKDKKDVCVMSTVHNATSLAAKTKGGKDTVKPNVVLAYNGTMGGVDKADQELTFYPVMRKQQKRYYKKIFRHLLDQCLWNAYVLFAENNAAQSSKKVEHADFLWMTVDGILRQYLPQTDTPRRPGRRSTIDGDPERLRGRHFLEYVPPTKKKTDPTRMCVVCCSRRRSDGKKVRKETRFHCPDCDVGLCAIPCFKDYHTKADY